ncbi:MAG: citrate lyase subunit alpha [Bacteroidales bacterium]|nr:MAG: citrate lyase subunit alpha [Bacteroidales bacterium]
MKNVLGRDIPEYIEGIGKLEPFQGAWTKLKKGWMDEPAVAIATKAKLPHENKLCESLEEAIIKANPVNGMTISFHHHLREGDDVIVKCISILSNLGINSITLASSSLTTAHDGLVPYIQDGTITRIYSSGIREKLGKAISKGILDIPVIIQSHGGRARAIRTGKIKIDLAIISASAADCEGNATGAVGKSAFGSIGYSMVDVEHAMQSIIVTDNLVDYPCIPISIAQNFVDYVVKVDSIGDPSKIASGTTRITKSPMDLRIAQLAANVIEHSGYFQNNFSFQVGAGGATLAVAKFIRDKMKKKNITGSFMLGGITSYCVDMLNENLFKALFDVQSFDAAVSSSLLNNKNHIEVPSTLYANPFNCGCLTNKLDIVVLGVLEIDVDFNVNVITSSEGYITGASGGHSDTASGAKLAVAVCPSFRGRIPIIKKRVNTIVTPGESIDVLVTERGICVNPNNKDLELRLRKAGLNIRDIHDLEIEVDGITGIPEKIQFTDKIVGIVEYRDGTIIDVIRQVKE